MCGSESCFLGRSGGVEMLGGFWRRSALKWWLVLCWYKPLWEQPAPLHVHTSVCRALQ